jgi:hypothetical protein
MITKMLGHGNRLKFLQTTLSGALENYKYNKHVSMTCSLRNFRSVFDSKREIIIPEIVPDKLGMYETKPFKSQVTFLLHRTLMSSFKTSIYNRYLDVKILKRSTSIIRETIYYLVRSFVNYYENKTTL